MRICYFGFYDPNYSRNRILISGLKQNGVEVVECNSRISGNYKYVDLIRKFFSLGKNFDAMIVGFPGFQAMPLARLIFRKKIIFDAFLSMYDSNVFDRKVASPGSLKARYYWLLDWAGCKLADLVLLDTNEHIDYFADTYKIGKEKFRRVLVGAEEDIFFPVARKAAESIFTVHFHGYFIPLHGIRYIIEAFSLLKDLPIKLSIVGNGQEHKQILELSGRFGLEDKIDFHDAMPIGELASHVGGADICLGIFGDSAKAKRVIPNKIYQCIAAGKPVITADTPAIREVFTPEDLMLCEPANSEDLSIKIRQLFADKSLRDKFARNGRRVFFETCRVKALGQQVRDEVLSAV